MDRVQKLLSAIVLLGALGLFGKILFAAETNEQAARLKQQSVSQLEHRLGEIKSQLDGLAQYSLRSGVGAIGYRSQTHDDAAHREWIKIDLGKEYSIDEVVIVPTLLRDAASGFRAEGFPRKFRVVIGTGTREEGTVIASFNADDRILPRIAPVVIPLHETRASWVLVEADILSSRQFDGKYLLQFAEILVFSGQENVAQRQPLQTSSNDPSGSAAWDESFAVDGFMPYLMNGAGGKESLAFVSQVGIGDQPSITIDLETIQPVSQVNLHLVDQGDTVPQTYSGDFGVPRLLRIEAANRSDLADAKVLVEYQHTNIYDTGPIVIRRFPRTNCRYVRFTAWDPFVVSVGSHQAARLGFAEIELIADGKNVALGKPAQGVFELVAPRSFAALTDGNNYYGQILPLQKWLAQLANRHDLEAQRPIVETELNQRYLRQKANLNRLMWLVALLGAATLSAVLIGRSLRRRAVLKTREQIAADLHDELGANFHAIGLLSDLAQNASDSPEKLKPLMQRMRELTQRTGTAAAACVNMLESEGLFDDLEQEMRRSSARIFADLEHELTIKDEGVLQLLKPRKRIDLFLFYKECLTNILRHSEATRVVTRLSAVENKIDLSVQDDGVGIASSSGNGIPPSLKRRAKLLGARVSVDHPGCGGTCISLTMRINKRRLFS